MFLFKEKLFLLAVLVFFDFLNLVELQEEEIEIPITKEIQQALVDSNPTFFGSKEFPKRATCHCKLELAKANKVSTNDRFDPPTEIEHWQEFILSQGKSFYTEELFDEATNTVSYQALVMFQVYLETTFNVTVTIEEMISKSGKSDDTTISTDSVVTSGQKVKTKKKVRKHAPALKTKRQNPAPPCE